MPDLHTIGRALYGRAWQRDLAEAVGVSERTMRYWAAGRPIPDGAWQDIADTARAKSADLARIADELRGGADSERR